jgi:hypothetical protein
MFEEWNSIGTWTYVGAGVSEISPSGQLHNKPNASTFILRNKTFSTGFSTTYTIEIKLKIDSFGTGDGYVSHEFYDGVHRIAIDIHADRIVNPDSATTIYTATNNDWHMWRFLVDSGNHILNVYKDGVLLGDLGGGFNYGLYAGTIYANIAFNPIGKDGCESHEDYIGVTANLYAPPINAFGIYEIESTDNGETWSSPTHVTEGFKHPRGPIKEMSIFRIVFEKNGYLYYYQFGT